MATNSSNAQKIECLKSLKLLNRNFKLAEKDVFMNVATIRNDKEFQTIFELNLTNDSLHKSQKYETGQKLKQISQMIKRFKQESVVIKPSQQIIDLLKSLIENIDTSITKFKEDNRLKIDEYENDEKLLSKEIEIYNKKIQAWSSNNGTESNIRSQSTNDISNNKLTEIELLKEVVDFDKFLIQNNGHNGGWEEIDHNLFLKIRNKYKVKDDAYFNELERLIVTKTRNQIDEHENWFRNYTSLKELKREAIKKWRENKKNSKIEVVSLADAELKLNQEIEKELKHRIEKQKQLEKQQRNKQLNEWRIEKEIKKAQEIKEERLKEEKQYEKELKERLKRAEIKEKLNEYKKNKNELNDYIEMEQYLLQEAEKEIRARETKYVISKFQERDFEKVKEKQEKLKVRQEVVLEKEKRLERMKDKVEVEYDPDRLYKPTSTWQNRLNTPRSQTERASVNRVHSLPQVQHLMVPSWRQGI